MTGDLVEMAWKGWTSGATSSTAPVSRWLVRPPSRAFFGSVVDIYVVTARVSGLMKGGLTPDVSNPLASSKQAGFGDRLSGFAANQATMCLAAYFGIFALAFVRPVAADPAVRV